MPAIQDMAMIDASDTQRIRERGGKEFIFWYGAFSIVAAAIPGVTTATRRFRMRKKRKRRL